MRLFGLTGGIATGKSAVSKMFVERGMPLIDADVIAREVVQKGQPAVAEIAARFPGVVRDDGTVDRQALGSRIFGNAAEREALNAITHPRIREAFRQRSLQLAAAGAPMVLYDAPLLIENGLQGALDGVVLVVAPFDLQRRRLMERNQLTSAEAEQRIRSQMPLDEKRQFARWIVDNSGSLEETKRQVDAVLAQMVSLTNADVEKRAPP
jgi:dephospho-CoA kinase